MNAPRATLRLSGMVVAQNEAPRLADCLRSLAFCDELIVVDGYSDDDTPQLAKAFGARVVQRVYRGCNDQKEFARQQCRGRWVLNLDADERVSDSLRDEILATLDHADSLGLSGFRLPVLTTLEGHDKPLRYGGWYPNRQRRLFLRDQGRWEPDTEPHDKVRLEGNWGALTQPIWHHPPGGLVLLSQKAHRYGHIAGSHQAQQNQPYPALRAWLSPSWRFFRAYFVQGGCLEGRLGFQLAALRFYEASVKYRTWKEQMTSRQA